MTQCPDCEEKDQIVIAGKIFCANCGTPWQPADPSKLAEAEKRLGLNQDSTEQGSAVPVSAQTSVKSNDEQPTKPQTATKAEPVQVKKPESAKPITAEVTVKPEPKPEAASAPPIPQPIKLSPEPITTPSSEPKYVADDNGITPVVPHSPLEEAPAVVDKIVAAAQPVSQPTPSLSPSPKPVSPTVESKPTPGPDLSKKVAEIIAQGEKVAGSATTAPASTPDFDRKIIQPAPIDDGKHQPPASPRLQVRNQAQRKAIAATVTKSGVVNKFAAGEAAAPAPMPLTPPPPAEPILGSIPKTETYDHQPPLPPPPPPSVEPAPEPPKPTSASIQPASPPAEPSLTFADLPIAPPPPAMGAEAATDVRGNSSSNSVPPNTTESLGPKPDTTKDNFGDLALHELSSAIGQTGNLPPTKPTGPVPLSAPIPIPTSSTVAAPPAAPPPIESTPEHIGSELPSLDAKEESVLSDAQFKEFSKMTSADVNRNGKIDGIGSQAASLPITPPPPAPSLNSKAMPSTPVRPMGDIRPVARGSQIPANPAPAAASALPNNDNTGMYHEKVVKPLHDITPGAQLGEKDPIIQQTAQQLAGIDPDQLNNNNPPIGKSFSPANVALSLIGLFLIGAYIWQVNYPNLAFKMAANRAGISANLPGYIPNGWRIGNDIKTSPGSISYNLSSSSAGQQLAISESKTDWDSQALVENYVTGKSANYLALQAQGLTIYLYGNNQASWVNKGNWYRIEGNNSTLSQDQVIKIATSL